MCQLFFVGNIRVGENTLNQNVRLDTPILNDRRLLFFGIWSAGVQADFQVAIDIGKFALFKT